MHAPRAGVHTCLKQTPRWDKFGAIRQIRLGNASDTRGTAFVVYEDIFDAKNAVDHLSGFNVCGRYLVVLYYQQAREWRAFVGTRIPASHPHTHVPPAARSSRE